MIDIYTYTTVGVSNVLFIWINMYVYLYIYISINTNEREIQQLIRKVHMALRKFKLHANVIY